MKVCIINHSRVSTFFYLSDAMMTDDIDTGNYLTLETCELGPIVQLF